MCAWKRFTSLRKLKLCHFPLRGQFDMSHSWWVVNNLCVCFLTGEHNSNYFQLLAFSHPPFTSFESVHSGWAAGLPRLYCLTAAIPWHHRPSHSSCGEKADSPMVLEFSSQRRKIWTLTWEERLFFFLAAAARGTGTKLKISGRREEGDMWQSARWAIYEMGSGHSVLGRKWKSPEYEMFRLSLEADGLPVWSQGSDPFLIYDQEIYR